MKPRGLLTAVVLLAILGGVVWWSNRKQAAAGKNSDASNKLISIPDDQFQEIRIRKLTGETIALRRDNNKWALTEPKAERADQDAVSSMVSNLSSLNSDKVVDETAGDLKPYGLDTPTLDIQIKKKDGSSAEVLVGDDTPTGSGAYAKLPSDKKVVTIASFVKSSLDKRVEDLRDKRMLTFDSDKLTRVELQAKGQTVEFGKNGASEWQILKPRPLRADSSAVEALVGKLKDAKFDPTNVDADAAKKFAAAPRIASATVTDASGNQTLEVHKDKDKNYFAKSTVVEGVYKIGADIGDGLDKGLDDFRQKKLFDFGFSDPTKIELQGVTYTKSGDKWMAGSKVMDNATVQTLIDKLRDLSATKFAEKSAGTPVFEATVTSNDGKRVEKVTIRKQGTQYLAQRENEPSIYELSETAVNDLTKAAGDVKEAPPPAPAKKK